MKKKMSAIWGVVFLLLTGCATSGDLKKVDNKLLTLRTEFEAARVEQKKLKRNVKELTTQLKKLNAVFSSFRKKGRYNFANIGTKMDELRTLHQKLLGDFERLKQLSKEDKEKFEKLFKSYASRFGDPTATSADGQVQIQVVSPKAAYDAAKALFDAGKFNESRDHMKQFIKKYPEHDLTDEAYILLGDSYYQLRKYFDAIISYNNVRKKFAKGDKVDVALLKLGEAHYKIGACPEGKAFLRRLLRRFRSSTHATKARRLYRGSRRYCRKRR